MERLASRSAYYRERYDHEPLFTAGANIGVVTMTEVGRFRREIAYHGDTLNTAARIQGLCGDLEESLLIPDALRERLPEGDDHLVPLGRVALRGRDETVEIFAVRQVDPLHAIAANFGGLVAARPPRTNPAPD